MLGILETKEAFKKARSLGKDLVVISPNASPPVCKILDYGKYCYEEKKKQALIKKNQKVIHLKEIKIRPNIGTGDLKVKIGHIRKFLANKDKVRFLVEFRGRENLFKNIGKELMESVLLQLQDVAKIDTAPKHERNKLVVVLTHI